MIPEAKGKSVDQIRPQENPDGVYVQDLATGEALEIETQHHRYTLVKRDGSQVRISGHPEFCPEPVDVQIEGSVGGRPMRDPKLGYIGRGMYLVFKHPLLDSVTTSRIREIHKLS